MILASLTPTEIRRCLEKHNPNLCVKDLIPDGVFNTPSRSAAVLILFLSIESQWDLLFIRRSQQSNDPHSGQVAFPGGRSDPDDDSPTTTALREAAEEISVDPLDVTILGCLPPIWTITNYLVTPVVGTIPWPYPVQPQPEEVSRIFTIPLSWLANPANQTSKTRTIDSANSIQLLVDYFAPFENEVLWGASARITKSLLHTLSG